MNPYGHDKRRRLSPDEQRFLYERADGVCQRCGTELDSRWHGAHLTSWIHGGATSTDQMEAWCWQCNLKLGSKDAENAPKFTPRAWQRLALPKLLDAIYHDGVTTLHAAPGAGKTFEIAWVFKQLFDAGIVERLLVVVPNTALVEQWAEELGKLGVHLDRTPRYGVTEIKGTVGAVVCYQSLPNAAKAHATRMDQCPTLVAWDEVHHLSEQAAWGTAARTMVGDLQKGGIQHARAVLNATGTLFRSKAGQRIATVKYQTVMTEDGERLQATADYSVTTGDLLGVELRRPDLYVYSGRARVLDLRSEEVIDGDIADLDKQQRSAVIRGSFESEPWLRGFCAEAVKLLRRQSMTPVGQAEPLKMLYIAQDRQAARRAADMLNEVTREDFARLIIDGEPNVEKKLRAAKRERRQCAIVAVQMVTEGFDCKQIATTAYASNKVATLFVAQAMARNMRVTQAERDGGRMLPAQILIPDNPDMRKAFASALASSLHVIDESETCSRCDLRRDECDCPEPEYSGSGTARLPRYRLMDLDDPKLRAAVVMGHDDGEVDGKELEEVWVPECDGIGIPATYAVRVAVVSKRIRPPVRVYAQAQEKDSAARVTVMSANPRDLNLAHRDDLKAMASWMSRHIGHDAKFDTIGQWQNLANAAGSVGYDDNGKGLRDLASPEQLDRVAGWMRAEVRAHCVRNGCRRPRWAAPEEQACLPI